MLSENTNANHSVTEIAPIYLHRNNQTFGPYEESAVREWLQNGQCLPNDMACRQGMNQWQSLNTLLSLEPQAQNQLTGTFQQNPVYQVLNRNIFLVKQQVAWLKASSSYDILDPESDEILLQCCEDELGLATKVMRFSKHSHRTPFDVKINLPNGQTILRIRRGVAIVTSNVSLLDVNGIIIGGFKQKLLGKLTRSLVVLDANNQPVYDMRSVYGLGWTFDFFAGNILYAKIYRTTEGAKFWTSDADDYVIQIVDSVPPNNPIRQYILAAAICADKVFNE